MKTLDMGDPQSLLDQALSPPNRERIAQTVLVLKEVSSLHCDSGQFVKLVWDEDRVKGQGRLFMPGFLFVGCFLCSDRVLNCLAASKVLAE